MNAYYTYCDRNYAVRAAAMCRSLRRESGPIQMYVFCLDEDTHRAFTQANLPDVTLLTLAELEMNDPELLAVKSTRSVVEYYFTCTSSAGWYLMNARPEIDVLTYLDSDLFFVNSVEPLFHQLSGFSIAATYHRFPEYGVPRQGVLNVAWLSWRRDPAGLSCLREYRRQCLEWCYLREEGGKYADQAYVDAWQRLPGFRTFQHRGANVAPWNLGDYALTYENGGIQVDGDPLIFFHFHKFNSLGGNWFDANFWSARYVTRELRERLIVPYIDELRSTAMPLPLTGSRLRHFHYRRGPARLARNIARIGLSLARSSYVHHAGSTL